MLFTSAPSLQGLTAAGVARVGLDGTLLEGTLPPIQGAVVAMHTAMYQDHDDVGCVVHTHSPYATAFAVANRPIDCWIEALAMFGLADGVPVTATRRGARSRPWPTSARPCDPAYPPYSSPTMACSSSIARRSWRS